MIKKSDDLLQRTRQFLHDLSKPITSGCMLVSSVIEMDSLDKIDNKLVVYLQELVKIVDDAKPQFLRENFPHNSEIFDNVFAISGPALKEVKEFLMLIEDGHFEKNILKNKGGALLDYSKRLKLEIENVTRILKEREENG